MFYVVVVSDNIFEWLEVGEDVVQDVKVVLVGLGLYDEWFGWGELLDEGVVIVSGLCSYVDLVCNVLLFVSDRKVFCKGWQIMMFCFKYVMVMDCVIILCGKIEIIFGIKIILSNLLFGFNSGEKLSGFMLCFDVVSNK